MGEARSLLLEWSPVTTVWIIFRHYHPSNICKQSWNLHNWSLLEESTIRLGSSLACEYFIRVEVTKKQNTLAYCGTELFTAVKARVLTYGASIRLLSSLARQYQARMEVTGNSKWQTLQFYSTVPLFQSLSFFASFRKKSLLKKVNLVRTVLAKEIPNKFVHNSGIPFPNVKLET